MTSTIVFDFWGVLAVKKYRIFDVLKDTLHVDDTTHPIFLDLYDQTEIGTISEADCWRLFCKRCNVTLPDHVPSWRDLYSSITVFNDDSLAVADKLKADGYRLALLSNMDPGIGAYLKQGDQLASFDRLFLSYEVGLLKPDQKIYQHVLEELAVEPEQMVFIDDRISNIHGAKTLGIQGIVFESSNQLETDLKTILTA